jgi:hypothetical protein
MLKGHVSQRQTQPESASGSARRLKGCIPQDGKCGGIEAGEQWAEPCCQMSTRKEMQNGVEAKQKLFCFEYNEEYSQCLTVADCEAHTWCEVREACHAPQKTRLGDGICDPAPYNTPQCNYDGGDCCIITCRKLDGKKCESDTAFDCRNPDLLGLDSCVVDQPEYLGDGICDFEGGYNTVACGFDLGDCCETTCKGILCAEEWQYCQTSTVWTTEGSLSYLFFPDDGLSYDAMQAHCEDVGGELARIDTAAQNAAALRLAGSSRAYIGLNDRESEGIWLWADGSAPAISKSYITLAFLAASFTKSYSSTCESRGRASFTKSSCKAAAFGLGVYYVEDDTFDYPPGCHLSGFLYKDDYYTLVYFNAETLSTISCGDDDTCIFNICGSAKGILAYDTRIFFAPKRCPFENFLLFLPFDPSLHATPIYFSFCFSIPMVATSLHFLNRVRDRRGKYCFGSYSPSCPHSFVFNSSSTIWYRLISTFIFFSHPFFPSPAHVHLPLLF